MTTMKRLLNRFCLGLIVLAYICVRADAAEDQKLGGKYVLNFPRSQQDAVTGGTFNNFAFRLDLRQAVKRVAAATENQKQPEIIASYDYAGCTAGQEFILEKPLRDLPAGNPAWVDVVEIEMIPIAQRGVKWTGGVCYGYREPGGKWRWNLIPTPLTYDAATDRVRGRISVQRGPIDALKLVFNYSVPRQVVSSVTFTTRAIGAGADPVTRKK